MEIGKGMQAAGVVWTLSPHTSSPGEDGALGAKFFHHDSTGSLQRAFPSVMDGVLPSADLPLSLSHTHTHTIYHSTRDDKPYVVLRICRWSTYVYGTYCNGQMTNGKLRAQLVADDLHIYTTPY